MPTDYVMSNVGDDQLIAKEVLALAMIISHRINF